MRERSLADEVVGDPVGQLRKGVRREGRDHVEVGPRQVRIEILALLEPGEREERLPPHEPVGPVGDEGNDLVAGLDEQPDELTRFVSGNSAGDANQDPGHRHIVPTSGPRKRIPGYLGYVYLIMPWAVSSMAMVK